MAGQKKVEMNELTAELIRGIEIQIKMKKESISLLEDGIEELERKVRWLRKELME